MGHIKWENGGHLYATFYCRFLSVYVRKYCAKDPWKKIHLQEQEKKEG